MESLTPNWRWDPWATHSSSSKERCGLQPPKPWAREKGWGGGWGGSRVSGWKQDWGCLPSTHGPGDHSIESWRNKSRENHSKGLKGRYYSKSWCSAGSHLVGPALPALGFLWAQMADTWIMSLEDTQKNHCGFLYQKTTLWWLWKFEKLTISQCFKSVSTSVNRAAVKSCEWGSPFHDAGISITAHPLGSFQIH